MKKIFLKMSKVIGWDLLGVTLLVSLIGVMGLIEQSSTKSQKIVCWVVQQNAISVGALMFSIIFMLIFSGAIVAGGLCLVKASASYIGTMTKPLRWVLCTADVLITILAWILLLFIWDIWVFETDWLLSCVLILLLIVSTIGKIIACAINWQ